MAVKLKIILPLLGTLPFIACALCLAIGWREVPVLGAPEDIMAAYGLMIASFMAGVHWGQHLHVNDKRLRQWLAISSNINALFLWILFLLAPFGPLLIGFGLSLLSLLILDQYLLRAGLIAKSYMQVRLVVTSIVLVSLLIAGLNI